LDWLPDGLTDLDCSYNKISNLDNLPSTLTNLNCVHNDINILANLPRNLLSINFYGELPNKPNGLKFINGKYIDN
jgi:Leucine-rich repeat (LRR) protein